MDLPPPPELMFGSNNTNARKHSSKGFFKEDLDTFNLLKENEVLKQQLDEKTSLANRIFYEYLQKHNEMRFMIEKLNECYDKLGLSFEDEPRLKLIYEHRFDTFELKEEKAATSSEDTDQDFQSKQSKVSLKPKKLSFCRVSGDPQLLLQIQIPPQTIEETIENENENDQLSILSNESGSSKTPSKQSSLPVDFFFNENKENYKKIRHCPKSMAVKMEEVETKTDEEEEMSKKLEEEKCVEGRIRNTMSKRMMGIGEGSMDLEKSYLHDLGKSIVALNYTHKISDKLQKYKTMKDRFERRKEEGGENKEEAEVEGGGGGKEEEPSFSAANLKFVPVKNFVVSKITIEEELGEISEETKKGVVEIGKELFENFFIIGTDKEEIMKEGDKMKKEKSLTLMPKIVYDFKKTDDDNPIKRILPDYCFPFGLKIEKIDVGNSQSYSSIYKIMYQTNYLEYRDKCFIMTLSTDETYQDNCKLPNLMKYSNPNKLLHCICLITTDYIEATDPTQLKSKKRRVFWLCPKIYCFLTYYPLVPFFFDFLVEITNNLKLYRIETAQQQELLEHSKAFLYSVDSDLLTELTKNHIENTLFELCKRSLPTISEEISIKLKREESNLIKYKIPDEEILQYEEALWCAPICFSNLPFEDFLFLMYALMLEKKIVLLSANLSILTSTILTFFYLLKPMKWIHPILCSLTEALLDFLGAPVPIFAGINKNAKFLKEMRLKELYPDCIFYLLDENMLEYDENKTKGILSIIPSFQSFKTKLRSKAYKHFNRVLSNVFQLSSPKRKWKEFKVQFSDSSNIYFKKKIIYTPSKEDDKKAYAVFQSYKTMISDIFTHLPRFPIFQEGEEKMLDYEEIFKHVVKKFQKSDHAFLKLFFSTQICIYHIENLYDL